MRQEAKSMVASTLPAGATLPKDSFAGAAAAGAAIKMQSVVIQSIAIRDRQTTVSPAAAAAGVLCMCAAYGECHRE